MACLRTLYQRLHSPSADQHQNLTRELLRELLLPVVRSYQDKIVVDAAADEFNTPEASEPQQLTSVLIRVLLADGWLEVFGDRHGLVNAYRFSRPGKFFAEAIWNLDRPSRSRQRNMRGCRNALDAALEDNGDAHDIVDAFEYAENVIKDLSEGIEYFQELVRSLMQTASMHTEWTEFVAFLDRFRRDYSRQLTSDNATLNRQAIRQKLERLRMVSEAKFKRMDAQLRDIAHWALAEYSGESLYDWMLNLIEDKVDAACDSKQPGFLKAMETYLKRINGLALQSMMLRAGQSRHAYLAAIQKVALSEQEGQDRLLAQIGERIATAEVRLLDPASFKLRTASQRRKAITVSIRPRPTREERLAAAMSRAESEAFSIPNDEIAQSLRTDLRLFKHPLRLSSLPTVSARDLTRAMQAVEATRTDAAGDFLVRKLPVRLENDFYSSFDYEIALKK